MLAMSMKVLQQLKTWIERNKNERILNKGLHIEEKKNVESLYVCNEI